MAHRRPQQQQHQQPPQVNYGGPPGHYAPIGEFMPSDQDLARSRNRQSQGGHIAIIVLLIIVGILALGALIASSIAAAEAKKCKDHHHRVRMIWDLAAEDSCDDMNPCTVDFADHANDPTKTVCMNHPRPNGYPCNSTCFFEERGEGATHQCKNLGKGCAECRGTRCKGECRSDRDCPTRRSRGPLLSIPQRASCNDGICVWEFFEERSRRNFPCDVNVLRKRCMRFVKPEFRECVDAEPTCGVQFGRGGGGGKRDEVPLLPMSPEESQRNGGGGNDAGAKLTRCSFSFKCARPSEPYIPEAMPQHGGGGGGGGGHSVTKEGNDETTTNSFGSSLDSFLDNVNTNNNNAIDDSTLEDFKKLTKKSSASHRRTLAASKNSRRQRHTIEGSAAKRM